MALEVSFFMQKFKHKEEGKMFSDEVLEKIFMREDVTKIPLIYQSTMIQAIQEVLEQEEKNANKSVSVGIL